MHQEPVGIEPPGDISGQEIAFGPEVRHGATYPGGIQVEKELEHDNILCRRLLLYPCNHRLKISSSPYDVDTGDPGKGKKLHPSVTVAIL